ncbi:unnamed protein product, partial [Mesorhabditis spiculigera]
MPGEWALGTGKFRQLAVVCLATQTKWWKFLMAVAKSVKISWGIQWFETRKAAWIMATTLWGGHVLLAVYIGLSAPINLTESRNGLEWQTDDYDKILGHYASCMCPSAGLIALVIHGVWLFRAACQPATRERIGDGLHVRFTMPFVNGIAALWSSLPLLYMWLTMQTTLKKLDTPMYRMLLNFGIGLDAVFTAWINAALYRNIILCRGSPRQEAVEELPLEEVVVREA